MNDLVAFLLARLDEDEQAARDAGGDRWHIGDAVDPTKPCNVHTFPDVRGVAQECGWLHAEHIARHAPERVLAEVEAKRRIIAEHSLRPAEELLTGAPEFGCETCHDHSEYGIRPRGWCETLRLLSLPYADRPGYREEWRPS
ncbi:DUF6221 family protein [Spirillospora sp. CA-253888]